MQPAAVPAFKHPPHHPHQAATPLTPAPRQVQMERSLFERLQQQGAPVKMLSVQYRMHPAIRQVRVWGVAEAAATAAHSRAAGVLLEVPPRPALGSNRSTCCPSCVPALLRSSRRPTFTRTGCRTRPPSPRGRREPSWELGACAGRAGCSLVLVLPCCRPAAHTASPAAAHSPRRLLLPTTRVPSSPMQRAPLRAPTHEALCLLRCG